MGENSGIIGTIVAVILMIENQRQSNKTNVFSSRIPRQNTTIQISCKNHKLLCNLARKNQTYDDIITKLLLKENGGVAE